MPACLPCHADLIATLAACDLVGVQTPDDAHALLEYFVRIAGATNGRYAAPDRVPIRYPNRSFVRATLVGF